MAVSLSRRLKVRFTAILALLVYAIVRSVLVWATFAEHAINPWIFLAIDCATTVTYVLGIEHLVAAFVATQKTPWWQLGGWALLAGASFAAPYAYIYWAGQEFPTALSMGLGVIVLLLFANAIRAILKQVRHTGVK